MTTSASSTREHRRRLRRAFLLGAASVLAVELVAAGVLIARSPAVVAGTARPATTAVPAAESAQDPGGRETPAAAEESAESAPATTKPSTEQPTAPSGQRPGTVRLPEGGTATLVRKELAPDAVLPIPENLDDATWWGAGLGAPSGASVFAGHVDWQGRTGPFAELWDVRTGQRVTVADDDGTEFAYEVSQIITLGKDELPARAPELFGQSGAHRLVLVTCGGRWLGGTTGYAENRVVVAEPA